MNVGDLVKMNRGYSVPGLLLELIWNHPYNGIDDVVFSEESPKWARVLWPDDGMGIEKVRDLETIL